jgi:hypothetical protein
LVEGAVEVGSGGEAGDVDAVVEASVEAVTWEGRKGGRESQLRRKRGRRKGDAPIVVREVPPRKTTRRLGVSANDDVFVDEGLDDPINEPLEGLEKRRSLLLDVLLVRSSEEDL